MHKFRIITKNTNAIVEISTEMPICLDLYSRCKPIGRIAFRQQDFTIAAGIVEKIL
jgi:elongation factor 1 alpha-like protein